MPKKILVVEDDLDMVELLRFNLKTEGYALGTAADGIEALKKARSIRPDLILLDLMLPELDGFAVCELLRRDPKTASIPIIMLTALSSQFSRINGLGAGANAYITKPFSRKHLVQCIQKLLLRIPETAHHPHHEANRSQKGGQDPAPSTCSGPTTESLTE
jgi:two-component system, OmpR family, alkaline phosphatase synthesis response regulator PhoP